VVSNGGADIFSPQYLRQCLRERLYPRTGAQACERLCPASRKTDAECMCVQASELVQRMPTDDCEGSPSWGRNPHIAAPTAPRFGARDSPGASLRGSPSGPLQSRPPSTPGTFVPISEQVWLSGFTSLVSHLGRPHAIAEEVSEGECSSGDRGSGSGSGSGSGGSMRRVPWSLTHSCQSGSVALQRAIEDIRNTVTGSVVSSGGAGAHMRAWGGR
jgi:hypothetical protein